MLEIHMIEFNVLNKGNFRNHLNFMTTLMTLLTVFRGTCELVNSDLYWGPERVI